MFFFVAAIALNNLVFGYGSGPLFIESLNCQGNERHVLDCMDINLQRSSCTHQDDVAVQCTGI